MVSQKSYYFCVQMKHIASILSIYFLLMATLPSMAEVLAPLSASHCSELVTELSENEEVQAEDSILECEELCSEEEPKGCCDDGNCCEGLCSCTYCHISFFVSISLDYFPFQTMPESDLWDFFDNPLRNGQIFSIWQPPRFIS